MGRQEGNTWRASPSAWPAPHAFGGGTPLAMKASRQKDATDRRLDYAALLARTKKERPWVVDEATGEKMQARYDRAMGAVNALGEMLRQENPDVLLVVGDDQKEQFQEQNMPMFCIFRGESLPTRRNPSGRARSGSRSWDCNQLTGLPMERLQNGTSELLNWVIVAAAMEDRDFTFLLDYMPSYRTEAGTGNGLAVGYWS
jgi:hypothetical protein